MQELIKRKIPSTGELLPCIGLGTWQTFDAGNSATEQGSLTEVLQKFHAGGGAVIDSSPMYGRAEAVVGTLAQKLRLNDKFFIATKVWTTGLEAGKKQMENSFRLLKRGTLDLIQVHNLVDWQTHLGTLRQWKEEGKVRYIGLTHYHDGVHDTLAGILRNNPVDFVQINYSLGSRNAAKRLLPQAQDSGVAVLINRPLEEGALFRKVRGKQLPAWAPELGCESWSQFFLKFILAHTAVTCVLPATSDPHHLHDNLLAGTGKLPDEKQQAKMIDVLDL